MFRPKNESFRVTEGKFGTIRDGNCNGIFDVPINAKRFYTLVKDTLWLRCIISNKHGWELCLISVLKGNKASIVNRHPTQDEIDQIKSLFWDENDIVAQFHINNEKRPEHLRYVSHLARKIGSSYDVPQF